MLDLKEQGKLTPEQEQIDLDNFDYRHYMIRVTPGMQTRLDISNLLADFRFFFIPLVFVICLGSSALLGRFTRKSPPAVIPKDSTVQELSRN